MENRDQQNPNFGKEADLSKAQSPQQPQSGQQAGQQPQGQSQRSEFGQAQQPQPSGEFEGPTGQRGASDTLTEQRSDIEGGTTTDEATDIEGSSMFVGAEGVSDSSSHLIEDDDFDDDRRGDGE